MSSNVTSMSGLSRSGAISQPQASSAQQASTPSGSEPSRSTKEKGRRVADLFHRKKDAGASLAKTLSKVETNQNPYFAKIGVLGGMGPMAGIDIAGNVIKASAEFLRKNGLPVNDQTLAPVFLPTDGASIGDRTGYLKKHNVATLSADEATKKLEAPTSDNPIVGASRYFAAMERDGVKVVICPCNSMHAWGAQMEALAHHHGMEFVHIVDGALAQAKSKPPIEAKLNEGKPVKIGLMATDGTVGFGIYQKRLQELAKTKPEYANFQFVTPDAKHQDLTMAGIYGPVNPETGEREGGVKGDQLEQAKIDFQKVADHLREVGADAISLSCTEIPLADIGDGTDEYKGTPLVNPNTGLPELAVERAAAIKAAEGGKEKDDGCKTQ